MEINKTISEIEAEREYSDFIKESVTNGQFFKDSRDWYFFKYITPICDRTFLIVCISFLLVVLYVTKKISDATFPLVSSQPIYTSAKDREKFEIKVVKLKPKKGQAGYDPAMQNFDDSILKYLLTNYVKDREEFDFSRGRIEDVNKKLNRVKNNSKLREYKNFQMIMSKDNKNSPIHYFEKNFRKNIEVTSVKFYRPPPTNLAQKAIFFIANSIPTSADVKFIATSTSFDDSGNAKKTNEEFIAKITFEYQPVLINNKQSSISFNVTTYALFRVKKI